MKLKILIIFLITTITLLSGFGQKNYHLGVKAGFSISKFPKKYKDVDNVSSPPIFEHTHKEYPLFSPVIGLDFLSSINSKYSFEVGIEYQMTGTRYSGTNSSPSLSGVNSYHENKTLHKLCAPITIGHNLRIKNNESIIYCGLRPGFLITGKYYHKWENNIDISYVSITTYNPVNPQKEYITPLERFLLQFSIIISNNISDQLKANLSMNFGKNLKSSYVEYKNNDLTLSITYIFNRASKLNRDQK